MVGGVALLVDWTQFSRSLGAVGHPAELAWRFVVAVINTCVYTILALLAGLALSSLLLKMGESGFAPHRWIAHTWLQVVNGLPPLLVLLLVAYGAPTVFAETVPGAHLGGPYVQMSIGLGVVAAAYLTPVLRRSLPDADVGGMPTRVRAAIRHAPGPVIVRIVRLVKDSALAYVLHVSLLTIEVSRMARQAVVETMNPLPLLLAAVCYLALVWPLQSWAGRAFAREGHPAAEPARE